MAKVVAFDSKDFERGIIRPFFSPVGAAVEVSDEEGMKELYGEAIDSIKKEIGLRRGTTCLCYHDFVRSVGRDEVIKPVQAVLSKVSPLIKGIDYFFVLTRLDEVNVYGQDLPESLARDEFLRRIGPYFVLASAWKYLESNQGSDGKLLLDHFGCDITGGSERVLSANPIVYMHGDECNSCVSIADLAAAYFDLEFARRGWRLGETDPNQLFPNDSFPVRFTPITTKDFHFITPLKRRRMKLEAYIRHPVVFFVAEKKPDEFASIDSKVFYDQFLYRNPSWHAALNLAWDVDGSAKMLEPHEDLSIIEDGDVMIYTGKSSKLVADYFSGQCPDLRSVQSKELFDQEKKKEFLASLNLRVR